jgi:hypothetical protein
MAGGAYGNLMNSGRAHVASSGMTRNGPSQKNIAHGAKRKPHPNAAIKSHTGAIKGMDRGTG